MQENKVQELKNTYANFPDKDVICANADEWLYKKWKARVGRGWYGFALGSVPRFWVLAIDDFLEYLLMQCPNLEIHQIKIKFGGLRFYVELPDMREQELELLNKEIQELEDWLFDQKLIY